ncbi:MAG: hypothetical protein E7552_07480 [Ruminococcaceae bacterium]|nr:hypothetical protein [Oscillospiraceae bacterium]
MKQMWMWFWLSLKRCFKRPVFLCLLALLPVATFALSAVARQDSGFLHIALSQETADDAAAAVIAALQDDTQFLRFTVCEEPRAAVRLVENGKADAAWIFTGDLTEKAAAFAEDFEADDLLVRVVERESSMLLRLAREKLSGALYAHCAKQVYLQYIHTETAVDTLSDEQLSENYDTGYDTVELFSFRYPDGGNTVVTQGYLTAPVRGVLAVLMVLCALATALFFGQDEERGMLSWVPMSRRLLVESVCLSAAVITVAATAFAALAISGLLGIWYREIGLMLLYAVCCVCFAALLRRVVVRLHLFAALVPLFAMGMLALCPVFFEMKQFLWLQLMFPPTYYLYAVHNDRFLGYMVLYAVVLAGLSLLLHKISLAKPQKV